MCLSNLCDVEYKVKRGYVTGYKCIDSIDNLTGDIGFVLQTGVNEAGDYPEEIRMGLDASDPTYPAGFHCFVNKKDALCYATTDEKVIKVLIKPEDTVATGMQHFRWQDRPVIVAKKIKINSFKGL